MLALQKTEPRPGVHLRKVAAPGQPGPGEVIVAVEATGICSTDVHIAQWTPGYEAMKAAMPVTIGHETCGRVARIGEGLDPAFLGRRVTLRPRATRRWDRPNRRLHVGGAGPGGELCDRS